MFNVIEIFYCTRYSRREKLTCGVEFLKNGTYAISFFNTM